MYGNFLQVTQQNTPTSSKKWANAAKPTMSLAQFQKCVKLRSHPHWLEISFSITPGLVLYTDEGPEQLVACSFTNQGLHGGIEQGQRGRLAHKAYIAGPNLQGMEGTGLAVKCIMKYHIK